MTDHKEQPNLSQDLNTALNQLKDFSFSTSWSRQTLPTEKGQSSTTDRRDRRTPDRPFLKKDHRPREDRPQRDRRFSRAEGEGHPPRQREFRDSRNHRPFHPVVDVAFYPEEAPFQALVQALRSSCRAYSLFEIAQLILEKPERFVVSLVPHEAEKGAVNEFIIAIPAGLPFETEEAALAYIFTHCLEDFFDKEEVDAEAPKGSFPFVYRCSKTKALITPPNYHKSQALLQEHHLQHAPYISFDRFVAQLEKANDPESIDAWLKQMSRLVRYRLKTEGEDRPVFDSLESARHHLLTHAKNKLIKKTKSARFSAKKLESLPNGDLKRSAEVVLGLQRRFPLNTVNHLRGRLRHMHFSLFKKDGIAYVSAVKRRERTPDLVFASGIESLVHFLEAHSNMRVNELSEKMLGIAAPAEGQPLSLDDDQRVKALMQDLRWLVKEGYVTEFNDGRLFLSPMKTQEEKKTHPNLLEETADGELETVHPAEKKNNDILSDEKKADVDDEISFAMDDSSANPANHRPGLEEEL